MTCAYICRLNFSPDLYTVRRANVYNFRVSGPEVCILRALKLTLTSPPFVREKVTGGISLYVTTEYSPVLVSITV
jgi:hypothetical protein